MWKTNFLINQMAQANFQVKLEMCLAFFSILFLGVEADFDSHLRPALNLSTPNDFLENS